LVGNLAAAHFVMQRDKVVTSGGGGK